MFTRFVKRFKGSQNETPKVDVLVLHDFSTEKGLNKRRPVGDPSRPDSLFGPHAYTTCLGKESKVQGVIGSLGRDSCRSRTRSNRRRHKGFASEKRVDTPNPNRETRKKGSKK